MTVEKLCINSQVKQGAVKRSIVNGREHFIVSSYLLAFDSIMNGGLYPREAIEANYQALEGTLAPAGHPVVDGKYVSAFSHDAIRDFHIGAYNRNVTIEGNRVHAEVWIDIDFAKNAKNPDGAELIQRLELLEKGEGEPIGMSVAVWCERIMAEEGLPYQWIANIKGIDHNAVLLREQPAAPVESGVGMAVNQLEDAIEYVPNQGAVVVVNGEEMRAFGYTTENGKIQIDNREIPESKQSFWEPVVNFVKKFSQPSAAPTTTMEANEMAMTPEERKALTDEIGQTLAANMSNVLKPLQDEIAELKANQKAVADELAANKAVGESVKRAAVAEKFGEVVANSLSGPALDEMHSKLGDAATLAANAAQNQAPAFSAPNPAEYFKN